ncbi:hypothetical protein F5984_22235 [Rudanella paleaurantiibacter]|uniref:Uncharacterized protein n=2 Tax=Rudanella paleaurantiibacter TaxID=2614655 RepID=A0A7J5TU39_9BACT|nr:hypothetical protein F5984_22235 [Rudanella paleaurantiibacter]
MRPLDIVVLLKIIALGEQGWLKKDLAGWLQISASEVSESMNRSEIAGLIDNTHRSVMRRALLEFLQHGLRYVFPQRPGAMVVGMPTAHSAPLLARSFVSSEAYVWPDAYGTVRGQAIEPLYITVPQACRLDGNLYDLLALTDVLRVGKAREMVLAKTMLQDRILT